MKPLLISLLLAICFCGTVFSQDDARTAKAKADLAKAAAQGRRINVSGNVHAQAVLIPPVAARRIFGKEIAEHYAVIEVNVGNKSGDAALIIHGIFIDYSRWALKGGPGLSMNDVQPPDDPFQASTITSQVASEEYRVVRGQMLDAQKWTTRNWTMRLLTLAGNIAGAWPFPIGSQAFQRELSAFSGVLVPGVAEAWPDGTIQQLNNISDFGFQSNKVIPKQASDIIVCFFPIERFLTPGFRNLYLKSPALFFAPLEMIPDRKIMGEVKKNLNLGIDDIQDLQIALGCYMSISKSIELNRKTLDFDQCVQDYGLQVEGTGLKTQSDGKGSNRLSVVIPRPARRNAAVSARSADLAAPIRALDLLNSVSLNTVTVVVDGVMSVDTTTIPAKVETVEFSRAENCSDDNVSACFWGDTSLAKGVRTGTIHGSYLTGGTVVIEEKDDLGIEQVQTIAEGSSDQVLHFSFKLTKPVTTQTTLHFSVAKPQPGSTSENPKLISSVPYEYLVHYTTGVGNDRPKLTKVMLGDSNKLTIDGSHLYDIEPNNMLSITLKSRTQDDVEIDMSKVDKSPKHLEFTLPDEGRAAGCWTVIVAVGQTRAVGDQNTYLIVPTAEDHATIDGTSIVLDGKGLDAFDCDSQNLVFTLIKGKSKKVAEVDSSASDEVKLKLPKDVDATWKLQVEFQGKQLTGSPIVLKTK